MSRKIKDSQYITLLFISEGFSSISVRNHLRHYGRAVPISVSAKRQVWRIDLLGITVEAMDSIVEELPIEWPLTDAFTSDRRGLDI